MNEDRIQDVYSNTLKTIEGVFDGQNMQGEDGRIYPVQPNYASKSKLIEGDQLKLYLQSNGTFIYKQTLPANRKRMVGVVTEEMQVEVEDGKIFSVLPATMSYFKGRPGDQAVIIVPDTGQAQWAAMENIIRSQDVELNEIA